MFIGLYVYSFHGNIAFAPIRLLGVFDIVVDEGLAITVTSYPAGVGLHYWSR